MTTVEPIRWLHLSDFHVGKDQYGQRQIFKYILDNIASKRKIGQAPDFVFITGDLANSGRSTEYKEFVDQFLVPLSDLVKSDRILAIPGNHDVDRTQSKSVQRYGILNRLGYFLDPDEFGLAERRLLFSRFQAYSDCDCSGAAPCWICSKEGYYTQVVQVRGYNIGILGLNTAWFSDGDVQDRHELSPGKAIVEAGLEAIKGATLRIVLGHHPLNWFLDSEAEKISALFGRHRVLYLHGHLHKNQQRLEEAFSGPFLSLQSGASFQGREDEQWINRILWCEFDSTINAVKAEPLQWSTNNQEWCLDSAAFPARYRESGTDKWVLRVTAASADNEKITKNNVPIQAIGWRILDQQWLSTNLPKPSSDDILAFFDGRSPSWMEALDNSIPRRAIVSDLRQFLVSNDSAHMPCLILLLGAGGEGKSTVLRQLICEIAQMEPPIYQILWHEDPEAQLQRDYVKSLPKSTVPWLIASDDADLISKQTYELIKHLREHGRKDICFLLTARDTDWISCGAHVLNWKQYVRVHERKMKGLTKEDAALIIQAWARFGQRGLGKLAGIPPDQAVEKLAAEAKLEGEAADQEGAFLGAMLRTRFGDDLTGHVLGLLQRLRDRKRLPRGTLLEAFAYIAALHAENYLILTRDVLARALNCPTLGFLKAQVLTPLGEEAAVGSGGNVILTRHRAIAECAVKLMANKFDIDFDDIYVEIVAAAHELKAQGLFVPNLDKYEALPGHFFQKSRYELGIKLALSLHKRIPENPHFAVNLAKLYRTVGDHEMAAKVYRNSLKSMVKDRVFFRDWAASEVIASNWALVACLIAVSLSDDIESKLTADWSKRAFLVTSKALLSLFEEYQDNIFAHGCYAATLLGLQLTGVALDCTEELAQLQKQMVAREYPRSIIQNPFAMLLAALKAAWKSVEITPPNWVKSPENLSFSRLKKLLRLESDSVSPPSIQLAQ
jgi:hypothetical protein